MKVTIIILIAAMLSGCLERASERQKLIIDNNLNWSAFCEDRGGKTVYVNHGHSTSYYCGDGSHTHVKD